MLKCKYLIAGTRAPLKRRELNEYFIDSPFTEEGYRGWHFGAPLVINTLPTIIRFSGVGNMVSKARSGAARSHTDTRKARLVSSGVRYTMIKVFINLNYSIRMQLLLNMWWKAFTISEFNQSATVDWESLLCVCMLDRFIVVAASNEIY